ncbi:rhodanese-like domain protein [Rhynchospora pubera]|uniref:Rhodanese-like domain protein n=1 Tax=Rhynchospora pubera TaxID=906938 RepID=A0AAV8E2V4_9POAL|nr:rhodanese-like domain protein [Rhynchospora pubera]
MEEAKEQQPYGVLLYYKYAKIPDVKSTSEIYDSHCRSLGLVGRVRIAPDGVNVTVGGKMSSLEKHIEEMKLNPLFDGTDFKLATCDQPTDDKIIKECGFDSLSVRVVKELVTFRSNPLAKSPDVSNAGRHLSATEFHSVLHDVMNGGGTGKEIVLLDARNVYETRIGKFQVPNVETLDPETRQYSDLPSWIDNHSNQLEGKSIFMYCTGGIRCEMASAYIRTKGAGFEDVFQLYGGIQRYLEQFPDGGFFKGKNFVFDHRISVGSSDEKIVGSCLLCGSSFDNYLSRNRCSYCRMLVLVCSECEGRGCKEYKCELCQKSEKGSSPEEAQLELTPDSLEALSTNQIKPLTDEISLTNEIVGPFRKLRILCLHGFRQNGSGLKGRTASLAKKLKNLAELVFIDAPHELPFIYVPNKDSTSNFDPCCVPNQLCRKKYAWLIPSKSDELLEQNNWSATDVPFDPLQYMDQTEGFNESCSHLDETIMRNGPFDAILGFSQGAAMAALYCKHKQSLNSSLGFRFGMFFSGYRAPLKGYDGDPIRMPSLHCFGNGNDHKDRQIDPSQSVALRAMFYQGSCKTIEHDMGHIIPARSPYIDQIKDFLSKFA